MLRQAKTSGKYKKLLEQDEAGTPYCITIDGESLEKKTVTIRDRDTLEQIRVGIDEVVEALTEKLS